MATLNQNLSPGAAAWASSVLVKEMPSKYTYFDDLKGTMERMGLRFLRKQDLVSIWQRLRLQPFVYNSPIYKTPNSGMKKDDWVRHCEQYLCLPGASQLTPLSSNDATSAAAAFPPAAAFGTAAATPPAAAAMPTTNPSVAAAGTPAFGYPPYHGGMPVPYGFGGPPSRPPVRGTGYLPPPHFPPPHGHMPQPIPFAYGGATAATPAAFAAALTEQSPQEIASRKRKNPPAVDDDDDDLFNVLAASVFGPDSDGATSTSSSTEETLTAPAAAAASAISSTEQRLLSQLYQMGFQESDKEECLGAIRRAIEKNPNPDSMDISLDIVTRREEADEAKKMDLARAASEQDRREESQRLREQRQQDDQEKVLAASFDDMKKPTCPETKKLMFGSSWLLQYEKCAPMLRDICNNQQHREAKKCLIAFLQKEKNALKWYKMPLDLPKYWIKFVAGKRMLDKFSSGGAGALKEELAKLTKEIDAAMSLHQHQNEQQQPLVFVSALEEFQTPEEKAAEEDDDDDVVLVLDPSEVRRTGESTQAEQQRAAPLIEMS